MEKIALSRLDVWLNESWEEFKGGFSNLIPYGAILFALSLASGVFNQIIGVTAQISPYVYAVGILISVIMGASVQGIIETVLSSIGFARWHGREVTFSDVTIDVGTHIQGILGQLISSLCIMILILICCIPGVALLITGISAEITPVAVIGGGLLVLLGLPALFITPAFFFFTIPLIVDKRVDFWSAITQSVDCVRRDLLGMIILTFIFGLFAGLAMGCTCGLGMIFIGPFFGILRTRIYQDYYGMEEDHVAVNNPQITFKPSGPQAAKYTNPFEAQGQGQAPMPPTGSPYGDGYQQASPYTDDQPQQNFEMPPLPPPPPGLSYGGQEKEEQEEDKNDEV